MLAKFVCYPVSLLLEISYLLAGLVCYSIYLYYYSIGMYLSVSRTCML